MSVSIPTRRLAVLLAASVASSVGCYGYIAPPRGASLVGTEAQLALSDSGAFVLAPTIGPGAEMLGGRVVADSAGAYVIALSAVRRRDGIETPWRGEHVAVAHSLVTDAGTRHFSPSRTALFGGIMSAALIAARQAFQGRGSGGGGGGVGSGPPK